MLGLLSGIWQSQSGNLKQLRLADKGARSVLVMYVFSNSDQMYLENLRFFLREGVQAADGCEYLFIINRAPDEKERFIIACPKPRGKLRVTHYEVIDFRYILKHSYRPARVCM
jgi:hypothetical protein